VCALGAGAPASRLAARQAERAAVERAFREYYTGLAQAMVAAVEDHETGRRQLGYLLLAREDANLVTALRLALGAQAPVAALFGALRHSLMASRDLERLLALGKEVLAGSMGERGSPSINPVIFFKLQLILSFEAMGVASGSVVLTRKSTMRRYIYEGPERACAACRLRERCTDGMWARHVTRPFDEDLRERARELQATEAYKKALRKRQVWVEPMFGEAKE